MNAKPLKDKKKISGVGERRIGSYYCFSEDSVISAVVWLKDKVEDMAVSIKMRKYIIKKINQAFEDVTK